MLLLLLRNAEFTFFINPEYINLWAFTSIAIGLLSASMAFFSMTKEGISEEKTGNLARSFIFSTALFVLGMPALLMFYFLWLIIRFLVKKIKNPPRRVEMFFKNFPFALRKIKETFVGIETKKK